MNSALEYQEVTDTLEVPKHVGVEGFILAIRSILKLPRVVSIAIDAKGKITHTRFIRKEEPRKTIEVDFDTVAPSAIIRNGTVVEMDLEAYMNNAATCIAAMFARAAADHMYPVAWVVGGATHLHQWHQKTTEVSLPANSVYGLQVFYDRFIPDETLLLACAYGPNSALVDTRMAYKITMPGAPPVRLEEPPPPDE
jgi:hypothetical protein